MYPDHLIADDHQLITGCLQFQQSGITPGMSDLSM
jgi:hypothetical protein